MKDKEQAQQLEGILTLLKKHQLEVAELETLLDHSSGSMLWWKEKKSGLQSRKGNERILHPIRERSKNWDSTQNIVIEGDNLDALFLLQQSHRNQIKLIYIDPPYNTGRRFVYNDRFSKKDNIHATWLNMMYPRLLKAKELLTEDGVLLVSISDHEMHQLRCILDEIFGHKNFVSTFVWETKRVAKGVPPRNLLMSNHEYVLCYAKNSDKVRFYGLPRSKEGFSNPDQDPRGDWRSESMKATGRAQSNRYTITDPHSGNEFTAVWAFSKKKLEKMIADNLVIWPSSMYGTPRQKKFFHSYTNRTKAIATSLGFHSTEKSTRELTELFGGRVFDFPKPQSLLRFFTRQILRSGDTALDFFAGSGSLAAAVLQHPEKDVHYILVQSPEPCTKKSTAYRMGYETIADITLKRVYLEDLSYNQGYRVYKIAQPTTS